jgi:PKHD-type hydroxylase
MISIVPDVLDAAALARLRELIASAPFVDGKATAGRRARRVKNNEMMKGDSPAAVEARGLIMAALAASQLFTRIAFPRRINQPMINRYGQNMEYGAHVDNALMGKQPALRSDIAVTIFISNPEDYDGGELAIEGDFGRHKVKRPAGQMVVYPSSSIHRVMPITRGERVVAVTWIESLIRDPARRQILVDMERARGKLNELAFDSIEADLAFRCYTNLMRMWAET